MAFKAVMCNIVLITGMTCVALLLAMAAVEMPEFETDTNSNQGIKVEPSVVDLGTLSIENTPILLKKVTTIRNDTDRPVRIKEPRSSCGCIVVGIGTSVLAPKESTWLDLEVASSTLGPRQSKIWIECYEPQTQIIQIPVRYELIESVKTQPNHLKLIFSENQPTVESSVRLIANDEHTSFQDIRISLSSVKNVFCEIVRKEVRIDLDGHNSVDIRVRCKVHELSATRLGQMHVAWSEGWKVIPVKIICQPNYKLDPAQVMLMPVALNQKLQKTVRIFRIDQKPFAVTTFTSEIPGLEVTPLDKGEAPVHRFRLTFRSNQVGIIKGKVRFVTQPVETWPIVLQFYALVREYVSGDKSVPRVVEESSAVGRGPSSCSDAKTQHEPTGS